ncbi:FHA domain-containing protein [Paenibacillus sp. F411]|nr:FHA domain-containing protein [Paenibacillus sp. F411]
MFGMTRDFVQNAGTLMVLAKDQGLDEKDISHVQMGMIRAVSIPHFLPLYLKEMDCSITLEYNISGKKMLSQVLRTEKLTLTEFYALLLQIVTALQDSGKYMLKADQYVLNEEYMFLEGPLHSGLIYLTYLPFTAGVWASEQSLADSIKSLVTRWLALVKELQGNGIQSLLHACSQEEFELAGLKKLLLGLMAGSGEHDAAVQHQAEVAQLVSHTADALHLRSGADTRSKPNVKNEPNPLNASHMPSAPQIPHIRNGSSSSKSPVTPFPGAAQPQRGREERPLQTVWNANSVKQLQVNMTTGSPGLPASGASGTEAWESGGWDELYDDEPRQTSSSVYWLLGGLLAIAVVWRFVYMDAPSAGGMWLSSAASAVLGTIAVLGWKGRLGLLQGWFSKKVSDRMDAGMPEDVSGPLHFDRKEAEKHIFSLERFTGLLSGRGGKKDRSGHTPDLDSPPGSEKWRWNKPPSSGHDYGDHGDDQLSPHDEGLPGSGYRDSANVRNAGSMALYDGAVNNQAMPMDQLLQERFQGSSIGGIGKDPAAVSASGFAAAAAVSEDGGTVLLQPRTGYGSDAADSTGSPRPYLEVSLPSRQESERVELDQAHFIIGRSGEVAQYVAASAGVSRAHVELSRSPEGYKIKDLGSRNGTLLRGEPMVAYKEYMLGEGDVFVIAEGQYTFRAS